MGSPSGSTDGSRGRGESDGGPLDTVDGVADRGARVERSPPRGDFIPSGEQSEVADLVENVEISEDGSEGGVDEGECGAGKIGAFAEPAFDLLEFPRQGACLGRESRFIGGVVEAADVVQDGRAELDPGSVLGAL